MKPKIEWVNREEERECLVVPLGGLLSAAVARVIAQMYYDAGKSDEAAEFEDFAERSEQYAESVRDEARALRKSIKERGYNLVQLPSHDMDGNQYMPRATGAQLAETSEMPTANEEGQPPLVVTDSTMRTWTMDKETAHAYMATGPADSAFQQAGIRTPSGPSIRFVGADGRTLMTLMVEAANGT